MGEPNSRRHQLQLPGRWSCSGRSWKARRNQGTGHPALQEVWAGECTWALSCPSWAPSSLGLVPLTKQPKGGKSLLPRDDASGCLPLPVRRN